MLSLGVFAQDQSIRTHEKRLPDSTSQLSPPIAPFKLDSLTSLPKDSANSTASDQPLDSMVVRDASTGIETTIFYHAEDSIMMDVQLKTAYLFGKSQIKYQDMQLDADKIEIKWDQNIITARGSIDSLGNYFGHPVWKQGIDNYETDSMRYNMKTSKGIIHGIVTKQGEGYLQGDTAKRTEEAIYLKNGIYTTCNQKHPHFYISARKLKVVPDDKAICGPFNLVIEDIPTPLGFWMGFFPITDKKSSGIIFPTFGENQNRGMFISKGGYYWAINDYAGLEITGDLYANGSWLVNANTRYTKRYKYNGNLDFSASQLKQGFNPATDETASPRQFRVVWKHSTIAKRNGNITANVNLTSSKFTQQNDFTPNRSNNNSTSSISYSRIFGRTPFSTNISMRAAQNNFQSTATNSSSAIYNVTLPSASLTMNRINPLKRKVGDGNKWFEKIFVNYQGNFNYDLTNQQKFFNSTKGILEDSTLQISEQNLTNYILPNARWGVGHTATVASTFKLLKHFNFNPSVNYFENWHGKKTSFEYDPVTRRKIDIDTVSGFFRTYYFNTAFDLNTRIYGTKQFKGNGYIKGIRHTLNPSVRFTYAPDFSQLDGGGYTPVEGDLDKNGETKRYFQYLSRPTPQGKQAVLDVSLANILEAKVKNKKDTTGTSQYKKSSILDNLSITGGYNFAADSIKMKNINITARTKLFGKFDIAFNSTFDPYTYFADSFKVFNGRKTFYQERKTDTYLFESSGRLANLSNLTFNVGTSFRPKPKKAGPAPQTNTLQSQADLNYIRANPNLYVDFNVPYGLNLNYTYNYSKPGLADKVVNQTITASGDLSLSPKWKIIYTTGYNIIEKSITISNFTFSRDLHCWQMNMTLSPFGTFKTFMFTISAKSQMLQQLKLTKRAPTFIQ